MNEDDERMKDEAREGNRGDDDRQHQSDGEDSELGGTEALSYLSRRERVPPFGSAQGRLRGGRRRPLPEYDPAAGALGGALRLLKAALRTARCYSSHRQTSSGY